MLQRIRQLLSNEKGFTLIELLIVIIILAVLAGVVVFAVQGADDRGQKSACKIDTRTIRTAQDAYYASPTAGDGNYAATEADLVPKFLSEVSTLHNTVGNNAATPKTFSVTVDDAKCGTKGAAVDGTSNF